MTLLLAGRIVRVSLVCWTLTVVTVHGFSPARPTTVGISTKATSCLFYVRNIPPEPAIETPLPVILRRSKPKIETISSLYELQYFLDFDDRPVAIKFYAPWCKTCQKVGSGFDRIARERGDRVTDRQKVLGSVRFAQVEYNPRSAAFITQTLQVPGVPTFQLYSGTNKLWEEIGSKSIKGLETALDSIHGLSKEEIQDQAQQTDDGILQAALQESFFQPDFLNEEW